MRSVPIPEVKHNRHLGSVLVLNNKLSWTEPIKGEHGTCSRMTGVLRRLLGNFNGCSQSNFTRCYLTTHEICVPSLEWKTNAKPAKIARFIFQETWDSPASSKESICLSLSGSALQDEIKSCMPHRRTCAHFFPCMLQQQRDICSEIFKVRVPSSSNKEIVHIVELCPTVRSPLEHTSEGNPGVQYVDQVLNRTNNPIYLISLMSTFAFFNFQMKFQVCRTSTMS